MRRWRHWPWIVTLVLSILGGILAVMISAFLFSCGGLAANTPTNLQHAASLTARAYAHDDAGTIHEAEDRAAHCSIQAVITDEKLPPFDAGIACP